MKKVLLILICCQMLLAGVVFAETNESVDIEKFQALGILWDTENDEYNLGDFITRGEFAILINKISGKGNLSGVNKTTDVYQSENENAGGFFDGVYDDETDVSKKVYDIDFYNAVCDAVSDKLMHVYDDGSFAPEKPVKFKEVSYALVKILGYNELAELEGGYPSGYEKIAFEIGLSDNVFVSGDSFITGTDMLRILENLIDTELMTPEFSDGTWRYAVRKDSNILEEKLGIHKLEGRITANEYTSLLGEEKAPVGSVMIDGITMYTGESGASFLLGYNVDVYYYEENDEYTIYWLEPDRSEALFIYAQDIENYEDRVLEYNVNEKIKKAKISQQCMVIYNGVAVSQYNNADFMPETGDVTLINTDRDSYYDIALIMDYKNYFIDSVDFENCKLYDKFSNTVEWSNDAEVLLVNDTFNRISQGDITSNSLVSMAQSKDNSLVTFVLDSKTIKGTIDGILKEENILIIDGEEYYYDSIYKNSEDLDIGYSGTFYLDIDGKIAYFKKDSFGEWIPAYGIRGYIDESDCFTIKLFDGEIKELKVKDKVKIDGVRQRDASGAHALFMKEEFFLYKTDSSGVITAIDYSSKGMPASTESKNSLRFMKELNQSVFYRPKNQSFSGQFSITEKTKVFVVPDDKKMYAKYRLTGSGKFVSNVYYDGLKAYCIGDDCEAAEYVVFDEGKQPPTMYTYAEFYIVKGTNQELNEYDEIITVLEYYDVAGKLNKAEVGKKINVSGIESGDIVQLCVTDGVIKQINLSFVYKTRTMGPGSSTTSISSYYTYAHRKLGKTLFLTSGSTTVSDIYSLRMIPVSCPVLKYNLKKKQLEIGDLTDIIDYERSHSEFTEFFMRMSNDVPEFILIWDEK